VEAKERKREREGKRGKLLYRATEQLLRSSTVIIAVGVNGVTAGITRRFIVGIDVDGKMMEKGRNKGRRDRSSKRRRSSTRGRRGGGKGERGTNQRRRGSSSDDNSSRKRRRRRREKRGNIGGGGRAYVRCHISRTDSTGIY
jgi:hypothetical protein